MQDLYASHLAVGWVPVWTELATRGKLMSEGINPVPGHHMLTIKIARASERMYVQVPVLHNYANTMTWSPKVTAETPGSCVSVVPNSSYSTSATRVGSVQGYGPFACPSFGIPDRTLEPANPTVAGLDIEQTTYLRSGGFPLATDPLLSIALFFNSGKSYCGYTIGKCSDMDLVSDPDLTLRKFESSNAMVDWVMEILIATTPDFLCIHNGYGYDIPRIAAHCSQRYEHYLSRVNLGKSDKGVDLMIPGVSVIDTWWYIQKLHRSEYPSMSLDAISKHLGGTGKLPFPPMDLSLSNEDTTVDRNVAYHIYDAYLHVQVAMKSGILNEIMSLCAATRSPVSDVARFISGSMMTNLTASYALAKGVMVDWSPEPKSYMKFRGASVLEPMLGLHHRVTIFDFKSLYPSIMIAANISAETVSRSPEPETHTKLDWCDEYLTVGTNAGVAIMPRSIPGIQRDLMSDIIRRRSEIKASNRGRDTTLSFALKIAANSSYGTLGARSTGASCRLGAAAVTACGRWLLLLAMLSCRILNIKCLYGDTDSVFVCPGPDTYVTVAMFLNTFNSIKSHTPFASIVLQREMFMNRLILVKPKMYYDISDTGIPVTKGLSAKRKDRIGIARDAASEICRIVAMAPNHQSTLSQCEVYVYRLSVDVSLGITSLRSCSYERKIDGNMYLVYMDAGGDLVRHPLGEPSDGASKPDYHWVWQSIVRSVNPILKSCNLPSVSSLIGGRARRLGASSTTT